MFGVSPFGVAGYGGLESSAPAVAIAPDNVVSAASSTSPSLAYTAPPAATTWTNTATVTKTDLGNGFYKFEKTGGTDGGVNDAYARSSVGMPGDFTLIFQRPADPFAGSGEIFGGITDDRGASFPSNDYRSLDRGIYFIANWWTFDLGFSNTVDRGAYATTDYLVIQRRGLEVKHYKTADLTNLGTSVKTLNDGLVADGWLSLSRVGNILIAKMIDDSAPAPIVTVNPNAATSAHTSSQPTLAALSAVTPNNSTSAHTATQPTLAAKSAVTPDNVVSAHTSTQPTLAGKTSIAPANSTSAHTSTEPALAAKVAVAPANAVSAHTSTQPTLAAKSVVAPASATSAHTASSPTLAAKSAVAPADAAHAHTSSSPTLTLAGVIAPNPATSSHTSSSPALAAISQVMADSVVHLHTSSSPTVGYAPGSIALTPNGSTSPHFSSLPALLWNAPPVWVRDAATGAGVVTGEGAASGTALTRDPVSAATTVLRDSGGAASILTPDPAMPPSSLLES